MTSHNVDRIAAQVGQSSSFHKDAIKMFEDEQDQYTPRGNNNVRNRSSRKKAFKHLLYKKYDSHGMPLTPRGNTSNGNNTNNCRGGICKRISNSVGRMFGKGRKTRRVRKTRRN
jgi:hypothetical protein